MPRIYQRKKDNPYELRRDIFCRMLWVVRGYEATKAEYYDIIRYKPPILSGMPRSTTMLRPTEGVATKLATEKYKELHAVESALENTPPKFREPIYKRIVSDKQYDFSEHCEDTWKDYEAEFLYNIAVNLDLVEPIPQYVEKRC